MKIIHIGTVPIITRFPSDFAAMVWLGLTVPVEVTAPAETAFPDELVLLDTADVDVLELEVVPLELSPAGCPSFLLSANPILEFA
jgi:hypothetical protein